MVRPPNPQSLSVGADLTETGFDLLLTGIGSDCIVTVGSKEGAEHVAKFARLRNLSGDEIAKQKAAREKVSAKYELSLDAASERLPKLLEENYDDPYWGSSSASCLSCGQTHNQRSKGGGRRICPSPG